MVIFVEKSENRRKNFYIIFASIVAVILIVYTIMRMFDKEPPPSPDLIAAVAKKCLLSSGTINAGRDTKFLPVYSLTVIDPVEKIYRVDSKVITPVMHMKRNSVIPYSVTLKYEGNGRGKLISCKYHLKKAKNNTSKKSGYCLNINTVAISEQIKRLNQAMDDKVKK